MESFALTSTTETMAPNTQRNNKVQWIGFGLMVLGSTVLCGASEVTRDVGQAWNSWAYVIGVLLFAPGCIMLIHWAREAHRRDPNSITSFDTRRWWVRIYLVYFAAFLPYLAGLIVLSKLVLEGELARNASLLVGGLLYILGLIFVAKWTGLPTRHT
jgi:hypothetical protein